MTLSLGNAGLFIDSDGLGPAAAQLLLGEVEHFVNIEPLTEGPYLTLQLGANQAITARIEIPGSFVELDTASLTLAGVAALSVGPLEDADEDNDPDRAVTFSQADVEAAVADSLEPGDSSSFARATLLGRMMDGTPIRGSVILEFQ